MNASRQAIADQIADLAKACGGYSQSVCCGHGHYEGAVVFEDQDWVKFVTEVTNIIEILEGLASCHSE
jgi:hypothetical protein